MGFLEKQTQSEEEQPFLISSKTVKSRNYVTYSALFALCLSVFVNIITLMPQNLDATCISYTRQYPSPITDDIDVKYKSVDYDGRFANSTIYRLPPSKEVDAAWVALGTQHKHVIIPEDQGPRYGLDPKSAKIPKSMGGGFPALFEFDHHLHCVNMLRKGLWFNIAYYDALHEGAWNDGPEILQQHMTHCVDLLRQVIMCSPDIGVYGQYWAKDVNKPVVDFMTTHKCLDYDALRTWIDEREVQHVKVSLREGDTILDTMP